MEAILGYARVPIADQDSEAHRGLTEAGVLRTFEDVISGKHFERPGLAELLNYRRYGGGLCVMRLDWLGRSR
ncbi:MAG: recombinase family protein [Acidobacteriia bacterium]|nr:recombinase family protein [Terriglobia bacterium]